MDIIKKRKLKSSGTCHCCDKMYVGQVNWYKWYSIFNGKLLLEKICKACAKRELGSKNKKGWDKHL